MNVSFAKTFYGAAVGVVVAGAPGIVFFFLQPDKMRDVKLVFIIVAGTGLIVGALVGSTIEILGAFRKGRSFYEGADSNLRKVFYGTILGAALGIVPGLVYTLQTDWGTWNRDLFCLLLACAAAILGTIVGATWAILTGFRDRVRG